jgi:hypothetical protein
MVHGKADPFAEAPPGPVWQLAGVSRAWRLYKKLPGVHVPPGEEPDPGPCASRG